MVITLPSKLLTGLSKMLWNSGELFALLDSRLTVSKIHSVKLWQSNFLSQNNCLMNFRAKIVISDCTT